MFFLYVFVSLSHLYSVKESVNIKMTTAIIIHLDLYLYVYKKDNKNNTFLVGRILTEYK